MKCFGEGCTNEAKWIPRVLLFAFPTKDPEKQWPAFAVPDSAWCDLCRITATVDQVMPDKDFEGMAVMAVRMGKSLLDRRRCELTWVSMDSSDPVIAEMSAKARMKQSDATGAP